MGVGSHPPRDFLFCGNMEKRPDSAECPCNSPDPVTLEIFQPWTERVPAPPDVATSAQRSPEHLLVQHDRDNDSDQNALHSNGGYGVRVCVHACVCILRVHVVMLYIYSKKL